MLGIVGGLSPESTILYYKYLVREYLNKHGGRQYPRVLIYSVDFAGFSEAMRSGNRTKALEILTEAVTSLMQGGADLIIISANTPHMLFDDVVKATGARMIHIADSLAKALKRDGVRRVGLLGTKVTLTKGFYAERLAKHGIEAITPSAKDIEVVNEIIMAELTKGIIKEESRKVIEGIAEKLVKRGAQAIALACTELPLLIKGEVAGVKAYDTALEHVRDALSAITE
jgi:aspartate racemase